MTEGMLIFQLDVSPICAHEKVKLDEMPAATTNMSQYKKTGKKKSSRKTIQINSKLKFSEKNPKTFQKYL